MDAVVFIILVLSGFTVAFLHAAIPTHWLPFVVAARAQHWKKPKTLAVTGVAGAGHVLFTIALGVLVVWGGMAINSRIGKVFPVIAGGALITLGLFYLVRQIRGGTGHSHLFASHSHHKHEHHIQMIITRTRTLALKNMSTWTRTMTSQRLSNAGRTGDPTGLLSPVCLRS